MVIIPMGSSILYIPQSNLNKHEIYDFMKENSLWSIFNIKTALHFFLYFIFFQYVFLLFVLSNVRKQLLTSKVFIRFLLKPD